MILELLVTCNSHSAEESRSPEKKPLVEIPVNSIGKEVISIMCRLRRYMLFFHCVPMLAPLSHVIAKLIFVCVLAATTSARRASLKQFVIELVVLCSDVSQGPLPLT